MEHLTKPNVWIDSDASGTTQLIYAMQTNPAPLTVSDPAGSPTLASLQFLVTNPTNKPISITSITFTLEVGTSSASITPTTSGVLTQVSDTVDWKVTPPGVVTSGPAPYILGPAAGSSVSLAAGASVVLEIYQMQTVMSPGTSAVIVKEIIQGIAPVFTNFLVTTFPDGFYFNGLIATVPQGSALVPVSQIQNDGTTTVTLVWNSSVTETTAFTILYSDAIHGQQSATPTEVGQWTSNPLTTDTIFTVEVTVAMIGGQPLTAAMSTAVSVQNPNLVAANITTGQETVTGGLTVQGATQAAGVTAASATITGALSANSAGITGALTANNITVSNALRVNGPSGASTAPSLSLGGDGNFNIDAPGTTAGRFVVQDGGGVGINTPNPTATLEITGSTLCNGPLTGLGSVSMLQGGTMLASGNSIANTQVYANTDGFAVAVVLTPGNNGKSSFAYASIYTVGSWFTCLGGTVGSFGSGWSDVMNNNPNAITFPIRANSYWQYYAANAGGNQMDSPSQIWWFPLGGTASGETFRIVDEAEHELVPTPESPAIADLGRGPDPASGGGIGTGTMLASGTSIPQTAVQAETDGFALVQVLNPGDNSKSSFAYADVYTSGNWFQVQGGTVGSFGAGWSDVMNNNPNSMCVPISAGSVWQYYAANAGGNQEDSPCQVWWFPMGASAQGETYRILEAGEYELAQLPDPPIDRNRALAEGAVGAAPGGIGAATMIAQGTSIPNTGVQAVTDGFAVVQMLGASDNSKSSFAYGSIYTASNWFTCLGGTVGSFGAGWSDVMNVNPNSMCIPIPAGSIWQYYGANAGGNQINSGIQIWWFPVDSTGGGDTYQIMAEGECEIASPPPPPPDPALSQAERSAAAAAFLDRLEAALGAPLPGNAKAELGDLLLKL